MAEVSDAFERGLLVENIKDKKKGQPNKYFDQQWKIAMESGTPGRCVSVFLRENWGWAVAIYQRLRKLEWWCQGCFKLCKWWKTIEFSYQQQKVLELPWSDEGSTNGASVV